MLTCLPQSLCSWNYRILGAATDDATVTFRWLNEGGEIFYDGQEYVIQKQGLMSGHWTLERDGEVYADAQKSLLRHFDVRFGELQLTVKAERPFTRCFQILIADDLVGTIRPQHPLTRRATIECADSVPELAQLFSFWLAVLTWRRAARNNN